MEREPEAACYRALFGQDPLPLNGSDRIRKCAGAIFRICWNASPQVPDPRDPQGVRHPLVRLVTLVALAACAVLAGVRSLLAVSEWVADVPPALSTARCHSSG
ncbi:transposase family protein [Streptomyces nodosus]